MFNGKHLSRRDCKILINSGIDQLSVGKPSTTTCFLEVGACASFKLATKGFLRDKKNSENLPFQVIFLKQKRKSTTSLA